MSVLEKICEQASYTLHHINRAKLFTENSAVASQALGDPQGIGASYTLRILKNTDWAKKPHSVDFVVESRLLFSTC